MSVQIREFNKSDIKFMVEIWNEIVENGVAFPQTELLDETSGFEFFTLQSFVGVAVSDENGVNLDKTSSNEPMNLNSQNLDKNELNGDILGLYILHPNNVGRCGHIANASYAVSKNARGKGVGEILVRHSLQKAYEIGFRIMQFNAVVADNTIALRLYEKLGFIRLGVIKGGFLLKNGTYADIIPHYIELDKFK